MALRIGSSGAEVRQLQQKLHDAGFDPQGVDGKYGQNTAAAVTAYQTAKHLKIDGVAGNQTLRALNGQSSFDHTPSVTAPSNTDPAANTGNGFDHQFKQFREVSVDRLRAALPPQAQNLAQSFIDAGRANNVDPLTLVAISKHETGNWTSSAFRNKNNAMGISNAHGPRTFNSAADSINQMARGLANPNGYYKDATTIRDLWAVYAPGPATGQRLQQNDPNNLNRFWGPNIVRNIATLEGQVL